MGICRVETRSNHSEPEAPPDVLNTEQEPKTNLLRIIFSEKRRRSKGPAIFIDRDGVINCRRPGDYVLEWRQFIFMDGIRAALKQITSLGLPIIVISNQAAVGKGLLDLEILREITIQMHQALVADGAILEAVYYCTHRPEENCACRKPKPDLLYQAAEDFNIDLGRSIFVGDSDTDMQAGKVAGCVPVLFGSGLSAPSGSSQWIGELPSARSASELFDAVVKSLRMATSDPTARVPGR